MSTSGSGAHAKSWRPRLPKFLFQSHLPALRLAPSRTTTMPRTKDKQATNGAKRHLLNDDPFALQKESARPAKKAKLLDDSDNSDAEDGGVTLRVNDEYAKRFEYNKKREEKHRRMYHVLKESTCIHLLTLHSRGEIWQEQSIPSPRPRRGRLRGRRRGGRRCRTARRDARRRSQCHPPSPARKGSCHLQQGSQVLSRGGR